ncbi:uncharacterized protein LOC141897994 isoform X2 [Acropora palmata]|uniref:uncharacterized protein LOC141897994 isoform X2 n=1 Tax=Acropora palmata TaxID=6131 RepID=UPI003DA0F25A
MISVFVCLLLGLAFTEGEEQLFYSTSCQQLSYSFSSFEVEWSNMKPYIYNSTAAKPKGLFCEFLRRMIKRADKIFYKFNQNPGNKIQDFKCRLTNRQQVESNKSGNTTLIMPVMIKASGEVDDPCTIKLHHSKGPAYIVKRNVLKPLTQLGRSFINGGQIIGLTLILTAISGVIMWILDRQRNPVDFPASFIQGSWQGFWWAFVTMTTVGYGDTAPRSVQARLYSILWMLLGMVAFSVLTANFTSSLAHEIEEDMSLHGKTVAVLNRSLAKQAAVSEGAKFIEYNDVETMIQSLITEKNRSVNGLLLDIQVALSNAQRFREHTLEIGRTLDYKYNIGMRVKPPQNETQSCFLMKKCAEDLLSSETVELKSLKYLSDAFSSTQSQNVSSSLFDDYDFLIILLAIFGTLIGAGLVWEYFYFRPKVERINKVNDDIEMEDGDRESDKAILIRSEVEELCEGCRAKVENIMKEEGKQRLQGLQTVVSPFDGFSIIGNQLSSIPGVSSIKKIRSGIPSNVQHLAKLTRGKGNHRS